ncbi:MAG: phosphoribosylaminoimidazolesuccinocarboxamide synthase [Candidatus Methanospirareceae archaeon]
MLEDARFMRSGKAKDLYIKEDGDVLFVFTDRVTAFDGRKKASFEGKGEICCKLSCFWFEKLGSAGIKTHFKGYIPPNIMVAREVNILPVEVICRNFLYGSLWKRYRSGEIEIEDFLGEGEKKEAMPLRKCYIEFTTKFESVDRPISEEEIMEKGWMVKEEIEHIKEETRRINGIMSEYLDRKGLILADFKLEYGKTEEGEIVLADEVGTPDVCRFWDKEAYKRGEIKSLDKDVFRKDKGDLLTAYKEVCERILGSHPT